jgi:hypothetical protein
MCHNCGASHSFYNFLKFVDSSMLREYALERYKNGETGTHNYIKPKFDEAKSKPVFREKIQLESIDSLPEEHFAKTYVRARRIPENFYSQLYFAPDFKKFVESLNIDKEGLKEGDQRLIIPFYDKDKNLIAIQGRSLGESKIRYITIKITENVSKFYGLDRLDTNQKVYVVEGPIDSMFLNNAIATADSDLTRVRDLRLKDVVLVYDNEPRNKEIVKQIEYAIDAGFNVTLLPNNLSFKDINDGILTGISPDEMMALIDNFTFTDLRAKLEFVKWKKV